MYSEILLTKLADPKSGSRCTFLNLNGDFGKIPEIPQIYLQSATRHSNKLPKATVIPKRVWQNWVADKFCKNAVKIGKTLPKMAQERGGRHRHTCCYLWARVNPGWPALGTLAVHTLLFRNCKGGEPLPLQQPCSSLGAGRFSNRE